MGIGWNKSMAFWKKYYQGLMTMCKMGGLNLNSINFACYMCPCCFKYFFLNVFLPLSYIDVTNMSKDLTLTYKNT